MAKTILYTFDFDWKIVSNQDNILLSEIPPNGGKIYRYLKAFSYGTGHIASLFYRNDKFFDLVEGKDFDTEIDKAYANGFSDFMKRTDILVKLRGNGVYRLWFYNSSVAVSMYKNKIHNGYADYLPDMKEFQKTMRGVFEDIMPEICGKLKEMGIYEKVLKLYFKTIEPKVSLYFVSYHEGTFDVSISSEQTYNRFIKFEDMADAYYKKYFAKEDS